ncbi:hypothetical protein DL98DRAFT_515591 [Cadophora sp. DSE1049]|nr:hypothetical protein DL98DRAFT_515591 [Cadophora sp. DSE1049]
MTSDYESDSEGAAMAAAMGFSSFGGKPAAKKRKFNPTTDAFVEGQALEKLDRGGKKGTGSGGNMIPLGKTRVIGQKKEKERMVKNEEEIKLEEDEEEMGGAGIRDGHLSDAAMRGGGEDLDSSDGEGPQYIDTSRTPPAAEDNGPEYIDTSEPTPALHPQHGAPLYTETSEPAPVAPDPVSEAEAQEMQRRIDAILQSIGSAPPLPSNDIDPPAPPGKSSYTLPPNMLSPPPPPSKDLPNRGAAAFGAGSADTAFMQGSSRGGFTSDRGARGARSDAGGSWGGSSRGGNATRSSGRGERNEKWYLGYYDLSFNLNPWDSLERERGLEPVGSWLELPRKAGRGPGVTRPLV